MRLRRPYKKYEYSESDNIPKRIIENLEKEIEYWKKQGVIELINGSDKITLSRQINSAGIPSEYVIKIIKECEEKVELIHSKIIDYLDQGKNLQKIKIGLLKEWPYEIVQKLLEPLQKEIEIINFRIKNYREEGFDDEDIFIILKTEGYNPQMILGILKSGQA